MWDWLINILRIFFFFLDSIVYPLISTIYNLFMDIANTTIFTEDIIDFFASKVYALLGIFMLFKVSFSILTYIVNPDSFTDKSKGFSKMISNIVISLVLLLFTPWLFSQAMDVQRIILKDNIIGKVFTVSSVSNISSLDAGNTMAYETFVAFYHIDTNATGYSCENADKGIVPDTPTCRGYFGNKYDDFNNILEISYATKNLDFYMDYDLLNAKNGSDEYIMSYMPLISTVAGGFVFWVLLMFCFDIAVRSIKLGFLRMIAPVPIISRIDPKKGNDVFNKWVKMSVSTYLDLFIRLLAIYFAVFVISIVAHSDFVDASTGLPIDIDPFVKIFIIMGALLFAKQFPKLIKDLTGFDMGGKFTLDPLKKLGEVPLIGGGLAATGSMAAGALSIGTRALTGAIGNSAKFGVGKGINKVSKGKFGSDMMDSAQRSLNNIKLSAQKRWNYVTKEAHDRFDTSGWMGAEYKGDTVGKMYAKELDKERSDKRTGIERQRLLEEQRNTGRINFDKIENNKAADKKGAAQYDGVFSSSFAKSKAAVDDAKTIMYEWENEVDRRKTVYNDNVSKYGEDDARAIQAFQAIEDAKRKYGSAKGQYEYRTKLHDSVRMQMPDEAKIEDAVEAYEKTGGKPIDSPKPSKKSENNESESTSNNTVDDSSATASNGSKTDNTNDDEERNKLIQQLMEKYKIAYKKAEQASARFKTVHDRYMNNHGIVLPEKVKNELYHQNQLAEQEKEQAIREVDMIVDLLSELGKEVSKFQDTYR